MSVLRQLLCLCALVATTKSATATESAAPPALPAWPDQAPSVYAQPKSHPAPFNEAPAPPVQPVTPGSSKLPLPPIPSPLRP